ncbi:GntR family transcriptional regulator [Streptomyces sp. NPDC020898]|uniref:GntR family transcriptional regulator n=1 Tax=Streptomyces sp. NPDC020898 TaxID=3365101 RepID=UPI00379D9A7B
MPTAAGAVPRLERPGPLHDRVYEALLELITTRALRPGRHLVESELAGHLGVEEEADQLLTVRTLLEPLCAEGERAVDADDVDGTVTMNARFHAKVTDLAGNAELTAQVDRRVRWYYTPVVRQRGQQSWIEHRTLIAAIADRDEERATAVMRAHAEHTRKAHHECSRD